MQKSEEVSAESARCLEEAAERGAGIFGVQGDEGDDGEMKEEHTGYMLWDNLIDCSKYPKTCVKIKCYKAIVLEEI